MAPAKSQSVFMRPTEKGPRLTLSSTETPESIDSHHSTYGHINTAFDPELALVGDNIKGEKELHDVELKTEEKGNDTVTTNRISQHIPYCCFPKWRAVTIFMIIIFVGFLGPMTGNIYIPALPLLQDEFHVSGTVINLTVSVFMAVFSVGPLFWGAFADIGGRKILYLISLSLMLVTNVLLTALPVSIVALFILRIFQAFSSSAVISLGAGTVTDITNVKHRGKAIGYFMLGPNMGPILAPIISGLILMRGNNWRWLFGFTSIMCGVGLLMVMALLPETLRCKVGNADPNWRGLTNERCEEEGYVKPFEQPQRAQWTYFKDFGVKKSVSECDAFKRLYPTPTRPNFGTYWNMLKIMPVVMTSVGMALLFGNYYAFSVTFSHFLKEDYQLSILGIGAAFVCPGIAMLLGSQLGGHLSDYLRLSWLKTHDGRQFPLELRLVLQTWGILFNTAGCIGYGWSIQKHYHLAVVLSFSALSSLGLAWCSNTTMTYLTELLAKRAAGTVALSSFFRNISAAITSAIILKLCDKMGSGWCFTGLGLLNVIPFFFNWYLFKYSGFWQNKVKNV